MVDRDPPVDPESRQLSATARSVILVGVLGSFLTAFSGSVLNVAIPAIGADFAAPAAALGWIVSAFTISTVVLLLPLGRLADVTSRRAVLIGGLVLTTVVSGLTLVTASLTQLIVLRVLQGIGAACLYATQQAILADVVPTARRGAALGLTISAVYVGLSSGPVLGGLCTRHFGWRSIFWFITVLTLVTTVVAVLRLPRPARAVPRPLAPSLDLTGMGVYGLAALGLTYGLNELPNGGRAYLALGLGGLLFVGFILHERRAAQPLISPSLFRGRPAFLLSNLSALLSYAATFAVSYLLAIYLQQVKGLRPDLTGLILIVSPLCQSFVAPLAGRLSDRRSPFALASLGMALCAAGLISFAWIGAATSLVVIVANLVVLGIGFGFFSTPNTAAIMSLAPPRDFGIVVSLVATMRNLGMVVAMAIIAAIVSSHFGQLTVAEAPGPLVVTTLRWCFGVFAGICLVGIATSVNRRPARRDA